MDVRIEKSTANGVIKAPPSKSYAHRMLICAALSEGQSAIRGISDSEDMLATMDCISALGETCEVSGMDVTVLQNTVNNAVAAGEESNSFLQGDRSAATLQKTTAAILPEYRCRESGSTLRFFIPISLALTGGGVFTGSSRLIERGIGIYEELFTPLGVTIEKTPESITIRGQLRSGTYRVRGDVSSQFISGLLFALPLLEEDSEILILPPVESRGYIDITKDSMKMFGVQIDEPEANHFIIRGGQKYTARDVQVEGDWSNAAFLYAIRKLHGAALHITMLREGSLQGDRVCVELFDRLLVGAAEPIDISGCPDLGPVLFAFAAACSGGRFTGTRRLRIKESDRAASMKEELAKFGITMNLLDENNLEVEPGTLHTPEEPIDGHNDHRIVMACAVLMTLTGGQIHGAEAVRKSYPGFFDDLGSVGIIVR